MMERFNYLFLVSLLILVSCGGGDDGPGNPDPDPIPPPVAASLVFPENNTECNEGSIVSDTESTVTFRWNASQNTDEYTLFIANLTTNGTQTVSTSNTSLDITILRGTPYSWYVVSEANGTDETAQSDVWKFYNAGVAVENYAPFPAETVFPSMGTTIAAGTVTITWNGSDVDGDIASYDLYLDTVNPPTTLMNNTVGTSFDTEVTSGQVYYWKVVTHDQAGNSSHSEIFEFRTE